MRLTSSPRGIALLSSLGVLVVGCVLIGAGAAAQTAAISDVPFSTMDALVRQMGEQADALRGGRLSSQEMEDTAQRMTMEQELLDQLSATYAPLVTRTPELRGSVLDLAAAAARRDRRAVRRQAAVVARNLVEFRSWLLVAAVGEPAPSATQSAPSAPPETAPPCP